MRSLTKGSLLVLAASVCYGIMAVATKIAYAEGANPQFMQAIRFGLAAIILWIYGLATKGRDAFRISKAQLAVLFLQGGIMCYAVGMLFYYAIIFIPVSLATILYSFHPVLTNVFAIVILKQKIVGKQIMALIIAFTGIVIAVWAPVTHMSWFGILLAFLAAVVNCFNFMILESKYIKEMDSVVAVTYNITFRAVSFIVTGILTRQLWADVSLRGWGITLSTAVFFTAFPTIALFLGIKEIGSAKASIISTVDPVVTIMFGMLLLGEVLSYLQLSGVVLVIASVIMVNRIKESDSTTKPTKHQPV
ncbi:MAG: hypothetical protein HPY66_1882 [Firmicutes bacterium]|nr:hypothetical protein [Bacillota bacterium]MDI6704809.1 DMT family transporter [Bacillota bacterium]